MTSDRAGDSPLMEAEELRFRSHNGDVVLAKATFGPDEPLAPPFLAARPARLADGTEFRQLRVTGTPRKLGYERLDNEILAGLRLHEMSESVGYPPEVSRLLGYEATSADPFVLLEPYRGESLTEAAQYLLEAEQHQFQVSLLTGLCWLVAAGIAHRGIAPSTIRWDGRRAQITDLSMSTVLGAPREAIGTPPWAAREQRPGHATGAASAQDDIWATGRLIFYVYTREELISRSQIDEWPAMRSLLAGVFSPPEDRPTARVMLSRLNAECPVPRALDDHSRLDAGRRRFYAVRASKHPGMATEADAGDGDGPGGSEGVPRESSDQVSAQANAGTSPTGDTTGEPRSGRRLLRRFSPLSSLITGGLAVLRAAIVTSVVR